jgi:hypothetical protein
MYLVFGFEKIKLDQPTPNTNRPYLWAPIAIQAFMYDQKCDIGKDVLFLSLPVFSG